MPSQAYLVLEDGSYYEGLLYGAEIGTQGEAVYSHNFTFCNDILTDPAAAGKIYILNNLPLEDESEAQSDNLWASGLVLGRISEELNNYLAENGTPALVINDIAELCQKLSQKAQTAVIGRDLAEAQSVIKTATKYDNIDFVKQVTTEEEYTLLPDAPAVASVVLIDLGVRQDLIDKLLSADIQVNVVPASVTAEEILAKKSHGIVVSGGPGNPERLKYVYDTLCKLVGSGPILAIGLGCQMVAQTFSVKTYKTASRHNGAVSLRYKNHYEKHIVAQNSSYAIDPERIRYGLNITAQIIDDNSVAALGHDILPITGMDYYAEEDAHSCSFDALLKDFVNSLTKR